MDEVSKTQTLVANERLKSISNLLFNLAAALIIAIVARVYDMGTVDLIAVGWILLSASLIFPAYKMLLLLRTDEI
jgi:hypothetical protein